MRAWRNQHKMSDLLQGMEREYPHGQPAGMGAIRLDLPDASKELKKELLPENGRWFARYITQRLVLTCLGGGGHGADDAVAGVAALGRSAFLCLASPDLVAAASEPHSTMPSSG